MTILTIFLGLVFVYSLVSLPIERSRLTAPIVFAVAGIVTGALVARPQNPELETEVFLIVAEIGLVLLLFTDAVGIRFRRHSLSGRLAGRLLGVGMALSIGLGLVAAMVVFGDLTVWEAGILAAILAPTDAGLGQPIVTDPRVPQPIRQSLNIEAGLNDGLSVPFLLFFIAMALPHGDEASLWRYFLEQFGMGVLIGVAIGGAGGWLYARAVARGWVGGGYRQLGFAALPLLCVLASEAAGASMFIAAFVAGLVARGESGKTGIAEQSTLFIENWGELINLSVFFLFGLILFHQWPQMTPASFFYAVLSLTLVRMVPVALALWGTGMGTATVLFMGWFGPRGLASIVLGLVYLQHSVGHDSTTIQAAVLATVLLSILAHGLSAMPGVERYTRKVRDLPAD